MSLRNKIANTTLVFGASCLAPSVQTFNAISGAGTLAAAFTAASALYIVAKPVRSKLYEPLKGVLDPVRNSWVGQNFFKAAALGTAAFFAIPGSIDTYDDVVNNDEHFSVAFSQNVLKPMYLMGRAGVTEGLVPLGRWTTDQIYGAIEWTTDIEMPDVLHHPYFDERNSSWRAYCLEPAADILVDGTVSFIDSKIRGVPPEGVGREMRDTLTQSDVQYSQGTLCW